MRSVVLNRLRIEVCLVVLIIENLGDNNFRGDIFAVLVLLMRIAVCCIALRKARRIAETSRIEERMRVVDTGINVADLDAGSGLRERRKRTLASDASLRRLCAKVTWFTYFSGNDPVLSISLRTPARTKEYKVRS